MSSVHRHIAVALVALTFAVAVNSAAGGSEAPPDPARILHTQRLLRAGYQGQGVRVGVISNGASNYAELAARGVLPADVAFFGRDPDRGDEGDWMMQVVHQIAPQARLGFCPGGPSRQTVECARELADRFDADFIVDDINPQPVFDFPTSKAVGLAELEYRHPDLLFFTGAGNNGGGYYQGRWTPVPLIVNGTRYLAQDFGRSLNGPSNPYESLIVPPDRRVLVMLGTSANPDHQGFQCTAGNPEVTLVLLDARGDVLRSVSGNCPIQQIAYRSAPFSLATREMPFPRRAPFPFPAHRAFGFRPQRFKIAVLVPPSEHPRDFTLKLIAALTDHGVSPLALSYRTDGSAGNSATVRGLIAVAAVDPNSGWRDRYLYEGFANSGPQCLDYARNISGGWTRLPGPQCVQQPAFVVPDKLMVIMVGREDDAQQQYRPFSGDSAAGPAAAAVAALLLCGHVPPSRILDLLEQTAIPQTRGRGWDSHYGYGLIDADAAAVAAGILPEPSSADSQAYPQPELFHPSPAFSHDRTLSSLASQGDPQALSVLSAAAQAGDVDAQTWLGMYTHGIGDDATGARWTFSAATRGEPVAQNFLGSMYNRGWGVRMDPRAAQAWWLRAARAGVASAIYNIGTTVSHGRGAPANAVLGYALMRAAELRGMHYPPMKVEMAQARARLNAQQMKRAESMAAGFAAGPASVPIP